MDDYELDSAELVRLMQEDLEWELKQILLEVQSYFYDQEDYYGYEASSYSSTFKAKYVHCL